MSNEVLSIIDSNPLLTAICNKLDLKQCIDNTPIRTLQIENDFGSGHIEYITFNNQLTIINFDVVLNEDLSIEISNKNSNQLYFIYSIKGSAYCTTDRDERHSKIKELKSVSILSNELINNELIIKGGQNFSCNIVSISKENYFKNFVLNYNSGDKRYEKLTLLFDNIENKLVECPCDLKIAKELNFIKDFQLEYSTTYYLQLLNKYQSILSIHLDNFYNTLFSTRDNPEISSAEIQKIRTITNHIINNPGLNHSQDELCSQFFISQSKLQSGFKAVHKNTVSNFTRNVRLEKSENLLSTSELNVSEIVYTVGFTSRSYFSKIFKLKYGCNPTAYRTKFCNQKLECI